jgi:O-antigen ligase
MIKLVHIQLITLTAMCVSMPLSVAGANIFWVFSVLLGCYLIFRGPLSLKVDSASAGQPFVWFFGLFFLLGISVLYSQVGYAGALKSLAKYTEILLMPVLAYMIARTPRAREWGLRGFSFAMLVTLALSYARYFDSALFSSGVLSELFPNLGKLDNPTVFKLHITHNLFMAMAVVLWASFAYKVINQSKLQMIFWLIVALLGAFNVLLMIQGRTGHVALLLAAGFFLIQRYGKKGFVYALAIVPLMVFLLYFWTHNFHHRIDEAIAQILSWAQGVQSNSSMGVRMDYLMLGFKLALENILLGCGVGSFGVAYGALAQSYGLPGTINPHNQYIFFLVELGLVGIITYILLNCVCWRSSYRISPSWGVAVRFILLIYGFGNFFNSFLYDAAESLFFSVFMAYAFSELLQTKLKAWVS